MPDSLVSSGWLLYSARVLLAVSLLAAACVCGWWLVWRTVLRNIPLFQEVLGQNSGGQPASSRPAEREAGEGGSSGVRQRPLAHSNLSSAQYTAQTDGRRSLAHAAAQSQPAG